MATEGRRRALGQHFLRDSLISEAIAECALEETERHGCRNLMEIGPGKGAITYPILALASHRQSLEQFWLVEKDQRIAEQWIEYLGKRSESFQSIQMKVETGDFLELEDTQWKKASPFAVVSNLPYSSGTAILTRLAKAPENIPVMVLMFQAEVAQRLRAEPSTKARGSLSIWIQNQWDVKLFRKVPPGAFSPPPEVDSEVVILTRRAEPRINFPKEISIDREEIEKFWETFLKVCFSQRRKMLRSILPWRNALELSGVDGTKRAEALIWEEWNRLFQAVVREVYFKGTGHEVRKN